MAIMAVTTVTAAGGTPELISIALPCRLLRAGAIGGLGMDGPTIPGRGPLWRESEAKCKMLWPGGNALTRFVSGRFPGTVRPCGDRIECMFAMDRFPVGGVRSLRTRTLATRPLPLPVVSAMTPVGLTPHLTWMLAAGVTLPRLLPWTPGCGVRLRAAVFPEEA